MAFDNNPLIHGDLLHTVDKNLRSLYRKYESISKKLIKTKWSKTFNGICIKENIMPTYTKIRHHDPALNDATSTRKYQISLIQREIKEKDKIISKLNQDLMEIKNNIRNYNSLESTKRAIETSLELLLQNSDTAQKLLVVKKLNRLYNGQITLKNETNSFINLSDHQLTQDEKDFLNLGLNYHLQPKYDKLHKQTEMEVLYNTLLDLEREHKISMNPRIAEQLTAESTKHRNPHYKSSVTPKLRNAAKGLKNNENIVVRKADKCSSYVILNKEEYLYKLNEILSDTRKFKCITKNPIENLKKKANDLISRLNAAVDDIHVKKIVGDYRLGYIYGNVKIHKPDNPLRPIISQIPTPTYQLAKQLNSIITPYVPNQFTIKSTDQFIDLVHSSKCNGIIASLDVESLFTNVPIDETIEIILNHVYNHSTIPPPKIPSILLKEFLTLCTKEAPFSAPDGKMYVQVEGVAMGSPLGPTFANFYMGNLESKVFKDKEKKPSIYVRYVDDCFVQVESEKALIDIKKSFEKHSVLKFTYELDTNKKLPFLDVLVESTNDNFKSTVYHKPSNPGYCLNADSECVERYKDSVIKSYLRRAYRVSQNWQDFHNEMKYVKQILVNNNYSNLKIDCMTKKFLEKTLAQHEMPTQVKQQKINIFYNSQMHHNHKIDEKVLKEIITSNVKSNDTNERINVIFYYKNLKTFNLVMKNNLMTKPSPLCRTNVIYEFVCPLPHCKAEKYIGMTQTTVSRRLSYHAQSGSIFKHFDNKHNCKPTRDTLINNTNIIASAENRYKLSIKEALLIREKNPAINKQYDNFVNILKLNTHKTSFSLNNRTPIVLSEHQLITQSLDNSNFENNDTIITDVENTPEIPNFGNILWNFGIIYEDLREVPLDEYHWNEFSSCIEPDIDESSESYTISQRIKSLSRKARH